MILMTLLIILVAAFVGSTLMGCSSSDDGSQFHSRNFANSGCKKAGMEARSITRGDSPYGDECIEYKGLSGGYLSVNHINVLYNCEPGELKMQATISGNEIKIVETEEQAGANCICPYDLYCEVGPLSNEDYTVIIYRESYESEYARFTISYKSGLSGRFNIK